MCNACDAVRVSPRVAESRWSTWRWRGWERTGGSCLRVALRCSATHTSTAPPSRPPRYVRGHGRGC
eukprot:351335-Prorocentrum_minimum.AAC.1